MNDIIKITAFLLAAWKSCCVRFFTESDDTENIYTNKIQNQIDLILYLVTGNKKMLLDVKKCCE